MNTVDLPYGHPMKTGRLFGYRDRPEAEKLTALGDLLLPRSREGSNGRKIGTPKITSVKKGKK
jgi:hypothetical protein